MKDKRDLECDSRAPGLFNKKKLLKKKRAADFDDYFEARESWMSDPMFTDPKAFLASFYGEYFVEDEVDYEHLRDDICQRVHRARALFKDLFFVGYRIRLSDDAPQLMDMASFQNILTTYGHRIIAHGVEEAKGGMSNLLLMCVSGGVTVNQSGWGGLVEGPPNLSPLHHGPYYVIASVSGGDLPSHPSISDIEYILVPFERNIEILAEQLNRMEEYGLISTDERTMFFDKLISYQALSTILDEQYSRTSHYSMAV